MIKIAITNLKTNEGVKRDKVHLYQMAPACYNLQCCTALLVYERVKFIPSNKLQHLIQHLPLSRVLGHPGST